MIKETIIQTFDLRRLFESRMSELTTGIALQELIDNFLDEPQSGTPMDILISFYPDENYFSIEAKGTSGMDVSKMQDYATWGKRHTDATKIKEHGQGGKLAALFFLDEVKSTVSITSLPPYSSTVFKMDIPNWWSNLSEQAKFEVKKISQDPQQIGYTRIDLQNIRTNRMPRNIALLADDLGLTYGHSILNSRVKISLREIKKGSIDEILVPPITIPFLESAKMVKDIPTGKKGEGVSIDIRWGLLDTNDRTQAKINREHYYAGAADKHIQSKQIEGNAIYLYYHHRLLGTIPLSQLGIPGYTARGQINTFAVEVNIIEGWASKTVLKTALNLSNTETEAIKSKIIFYIKDDLLATIRKPENEDLNKKFASKTKAASEILLKVLTKAFQNNMSDLAQTFSLPEPPTTQEIAIRKSPYKQSRTILPGSRNEYVTGNHKSKDVSPNENTNIWTNPVPEFTVTLLPEDDEAILSINEHGKPTIELNINNPLVAYWLTQKDTQFIRYAFSVGVRILYSEKWKKREPHNTEAFEKGLQHDLNTIYHVTQKLGFL